MTTALYLSFCIISVGLIVTPGPNVLLIISNSLTHGTRRGLLTVAGVSVAMAIQLAVAAVGITSLTLLLATWFEWLRWAGVAYLAYLGLQEWRRSCDNAPAQGPPNAPATFWQGFAVSLTNPKTLLFFVAFLPQFISAESSVLPQVTLLSATFLIIALVCDCTYALLAARVRDWFASPYRVRIRQRLTGSLYLGAGLGLAMARRGG